MKLNRETLLQQLEKAYSAIALNPIVPHYSYFKISKEHDGLKGSVQAYNGLVLVNTELFEDIGQDCAIPAEPFIKLLRSLGDEEVELVFEGDEVKVKTDTVKGTFTILDETPIKSISISGHLITDEQIIQDLLNGLNICRLYVSKDQTSGPLRGVRIDGDKLIATDRYRIIVWKLDSSIPVNCSIPLKFIDIVLKNRDEIKEFLFVKDDGFTAILNGGTQVSTLLLSGEYRDVLEYFPTSDSSFKEIKFTDEMSNAMERHVTFLSRIDLIDKEISVRILKDKCITESTDKSLGSLVDEISIESEEDLDIEFFVNPIFLKDIVNVCSCFKYYDESGMIVLEADKLSEPDKLRYLTQVRENK